MPAPPQSPEIPALTGLRWIAAISVVVSHTLTTFSSTKTGFDLEQYFYPFARFGMTLFFVLSGFIIHYNYNAVVTAGGLKGIASFLWARFARLYPLFLAVVVYDILFGRRILEYLDGNPSGFEETVSALPYFLTMTQSWVQSDAQGLPLLNAVGTNTQLTWSISTEWFFYLLYPIFAILISYCKRTFVVAGVVVLWCVIWISVLTTMSINFVADAGHIWMIYEAPYLRLGEFILGALCAQLYLTAMHTNPSEREVYFGSIVTDIGILSLPFLFYLLYGTHLIGVALRFNFGFAPIIAVLIFCIGRYRTFLSRHLSHRRIVALGDVSYSTYLLHFYVLNIGVAMAYVGFGPLVPPSIPHPLAGAVYIAKLLVALAAVELVSFASYRFFEAPMRRWLRALPSTLSKGRA